MNQVFDRIAGAERHDILSEPENLPRRKGGLLKSSSAVCPHGGLISPERIPPRKNPSCR